MRTEGALFKSDISTAYFKKLKEPRFAFAALRKERWHTSKRQGERRQSRRTGHSSAASRPRRHQGSDGARQVLSRHRLGAVDIALAGDLVPGFGQNVAREHERRQVMTKRRAQPHQGRSAPSADCSRGWPCPAECPAGCGRYDDRSSRSSAFWPRSGRRRCPRSPTGRETGCRLRAGENGKREDFLLNLGA
jgi:hypothetical protein